jgi:hypothetical protein
MKACATLFVAIIACAAAGDITFGDNVANPTVKISDSGNDLNLFATNGCINLNDGGSKCKRNAKVYQLEATLQKYICPAHMPANAVHHASGSRTDTKGFCKYNCKAGYHDADNNGSCQLCSTCASGQTRSGSCSTASNYACKMVGGVIKWHGWSESSNPNYNNLPVCHGDCDSDSHCAAGLKCYHDQSAIKGCTGKILSIGQDYCGLK